jgi:hypothetical protein
MLANWFLLGEERNFSHFHEDCSLCIEQDEPTKVTLPQEVEYRGPVSLDGIPNQKFALRTLLSTESSRDLFV